MNKPVFPGSELSGRRPQRNFGTFLPRPAFNPNDPSSYPRNPMTYGNSYGPPPAVPTTPTFTQTPKSQVQNQFLTAIQGQYRTGQAARQGALTNFVKEAYAQQGQNKSALDQERKALDKVFATDGGLADELMNARAQRKASVMLKAKMAMDAARRQNNLRRMMTGNNTYNDRLYSSQLAGIGVNQAMDDADRQAADIQYVQGQRMGALGGRGRLSDQYLNSVLAPAQAQSNFMRDDLSTLQQLAQLENQNSVYESPLDEMRRRIAMEEAQQQYEGLRYV